MQPLYTRLSVVALGASIALLLAGPGFAADGVLEISQTCAVQTGCFLGDTAGLPVTITDATPAKSFRLTSDLVVPTAGATGISIRSSLVRIDLGGFAVRGPVTCSGSPTVCAPAGVGKGIAVEAIQREAVEVRNGVVSGFGDGGVLVGARGVVESVRAFQNGSIGISGAAGTAVRNCTSSLNGSFGILVGPGGIISGSEASQNALHGLAAIEGAASITGNSARQNGWSGIATGSGATISGNTVVENLLGGIQCADRCTIDGNTVTSNGVGASGDGVSCQVGCAVRSNVISLSGRVGLFVGADSAYRENVVTGNAFLPVDGGVNRGDNHCAGSGTGSSSCP